jgi:uncharacterized protein (DUF58 family)
MAGARPGTPANKKAMKTRLVLAVTLVVVLALALAGGFTMLWRFFVLAAAVLIPAYLWPRFSIRGIEGRVEKTPELGQVGDRFEQVFTMGTRSRLPTPLVEVSEATNLPGYENAAAFSLPSRGRHVWRARVTCRRRGRYTLGALDVKTADPLGIFEVGRRIGTPQEIIVYPATLELPHFQALPRLAPGMNRKRWLASETGPGAARVREYSSGDSLRHIHWPTTAHTGELMVKEFDPDRTSYSFKNVWIVPDMCRDTCIGEGDETAEEYGVTIAASLAKKYLDTGKHVGMIATGEPPCLFLPESGEPQLERILRALALMQTGGACSITDLLASEMDRFEEGSALIVIMPSDCPPITAPLRRAAERGAVVSVILLDSSSFSGTSGTGKTRSAPSLNAAGIQTCVVRRGDRLAEALDSLAAGRRQQRQEVEAR